ncbi:MAG TPA: hydrogenase maturation protease [Terriglobales bacterium]
MPRVLIIGCGNPLRCDDGLAWHLTEALRSMSLPRGIEIITQHQLTPELASPVSEADMVLFVDAARDGDAGEIRCRPVSLLPVPNALSHEYSPESVLSLAQELYGKSPRGFMLSLGGECFETGTTLSRSVEKSLPECLDQMLKMIQPGALASL